MKSLPFGFKGEVIADVQRHGHVADVVVRWNEDQVELRRDLEEPAVTDRDALAAMSTLPFRMPVPWTEIDPIVAVVLDSLPSALVRRGPLTVERMYSPPLDVVGVFKKTNRWTEGFEATTYLGRGAPRGVVLTSRRDIARICHRARLVGIGVAVSDGPSPEVAVAPSTRFVRMDDLTWLVAELVYLQVVNGQCHSAQARS